MHRSSKPSGVRPLILHFCGSFHIRRAKSVIAIEFVMGIFQCKWIRNVLSLAGMKQNSCVPVCSSFPVAPFSSRCSSAALRVGKLSPVQAAFSCPSL